MFEYILLVSGSAALGDYFFLGYG